MLAGWVREWIYEREQEGMQKGKAGIWRRLMRLSFGELDAGIFDKIKANRV